MKTGQIHVSTENIFPIIKKFLYSDHEIFLRELISNSSDAADKLRFEALSNPDVYENNTDLKIWINFDKEQRTITVRDNGIGMTKDEVIKNAAIVATLAPLPWQAFGPGTEGGKAQPAVWSDNAKFKTASEKMQLAVADLNKVAQSGDVESFKKSFGAASQTCKGCHDDFKKK